jgi:hypothetical protein
MEERKVKIVDSGITGKWAIFWVLIIIASFLVGSFLVGDNISVKVNQIPPEQTKENSLKDKSDYNFTLQNNGYSGWQMGCNYANGSNADWNEKLQRYGDQKYLECANGLNYKRIKEDK